jgi:hypothetical protein
MWDAHSFLDQYRGARIRRRSEAVRAFRKVAIPETELPELYRLLQRDRSTLARLLLLEVRQRIKRRQDLTWEGWFAFCSEFGLCSWLGRYAYARFKASIRANARFETWYERWTYVTTQPNQCLKDRYQTAPRALLRWLVARMIETAKSLKDWRRVYDAPGDYLATHYPRHSLGADNIRQRAWFEIRKLLP